jgi:hypothetical protein
MRLTGFSILYSELLNDACLEASMLSSIPHPSWRLLIHKKVFRLPHRLLPRGSPATGLSFISMPLHHRVFFTVSRNVQHTADTDFPIFVGPVFWPDYHFLIVTCCWHMTESVENDGSLSLPCMVEMIVYYVVNSCHRLQQHSYLL